MRRWSVLYSFSVLGVYRLYPTHGCVECRLGRFLLLVKPARPSDRGVVVAYRCSSGRKCCASSLPVNFIVAE